MFDVEYRLFDKLCT